MSRPGALQVARAFFSRGLQEALSYRVAFGARLLAVALSLGALYYLARFIDMGRSPLLAPYGGDYLGFGLVGMVVLNLQHRAVSAYPRAIREAQLTGTLEAMLATPTPGWLVLLCAPVYQFAAAFLWAAAYLLLGALLLGVRFGPVGWPALCLALPLCVLAFSSLGFLGAALTMLMRRSDPLTMFIGGISALLSGVLYPTSVLPGPLQAAARALPLTHALELIRRAVFTAATPDRLAAPLLGLALFCAVMVPLGLLSFGWAVGRARRDGSLTHF
jgi:ABC-2 type transport system permease protein